MTDLALLQAKLAVALSEAQEAHNTFNWFDANGIDATNQSHLADFNRACLRLANAIVINSQELLGAVKEERSKGVKS